MGDGPSSTHALVTRHLGRSGGGQRVRSMRKMRPARGKGSSETRRGEEGPASREAWRPHGDEGSCQCCRREAHQRPNPSQRRARPRLKHNRPRGPRSADIGIAGSFIRNIQQRKEREYRLGSSWIGTTSSRGVGSSSFKVLIKMSRL